MVELEAGFFDFIVEAKRRTYAAGGPPTGSCRRASKDLGYSRGEYEYLDSYFGAAAFLGEEAVYRRGLPIWGMNYYGASIADVDAGPSAMGETLHAALLEVPREAPYRGPSVYKNGDCEYRCAWEGSPTAFWGEEEILRGGTRIYSLRFHGGVLA
jgi:hypothetical protein